MSFRNLPFVLPEAIEQLLEQSYATPPRAYHNAEHINEVLEHFASVSSWQDANSVALALLFHDAIYVPGMHDNEARSAVLLEQTLTAHPLSVPHNLMRAKELILLTAHHGRLDAQSLDADAAHFVDCDMAILGSDPVRYRRYEQQIAEEYSYLDAATFQAGRKRFLSALLASPRIYVSELFHQRLEERARQNLSAALAA